MRRSFRSSALILVFSTVVFFVSQVSSGPRATVPDISVTPDSLGADLFTGGTTTQSITISNNGNTDLLFDISIEGQNTPSAVAPVVSIGSDEELNTDSSPEPIEHLELGKGERDFRRGADVLSGRGGPDGFGYMWIDSDETGGPTFQWVEISGMGTQIYLSDDDYLEISLPFVFSFYGMEKTSVRISSNGYLTFGGAGGYNINDPIPIAFDPNDVIAPFWDDLDPGAGGAIYHYYDAAQSRFIVQYTDIPHYGSGGPYTFQVILHTDGSIFFQYLSMVTRTDQATIGIENSDGSDGLEIAFNTDYVHDNLAVRIAAVPGWVSVGVSSGSVPAGSSMDIEVTLNATGLSGGEYEADIVIASNDPDEPEVVVATYIHVTGSPDILVAADTLNFGMIFVGSSLSLDLEVQNIGVRDLLITSVALNPAEFAASPTYAGLNPGEHELFTVTFSPTAVGQYPGILTLLSNDPDEGAYAVVLMGEGVEPPEISVSPESLYQALNTGEIDSQVVTIENIKTGGSPLFFEIWARTGGGSSQWDSEPHQMMPLSHRLNGILTVNTSRHGNGAGLFTSTPQASLRQKEYIHSQVQEILASLGGQEIWSDDREEYAMVYTGVEVPRNATLGKPLPDAISVLWDDSHDTDGDDLYSPGSYALLYNWMSSLEYTIVQLNEGEGPISSEILSSYDVLVIMDPENSLMSSEISAIQDFVSQGKSLFVVGEVSGAFDYGSCNDLLEPYGMDFTTEDGGDLISDFATHAITEGISEITFEACGTATVVSPSVCLAWDGYSNCVLASCDVSGKIVIVTDSNFMDDDHLLSSNNSEIVDNIFNWLSGGIGFQWLTIHPVSGTVLSAEGADIVVTFDATDLFGGDYYADIVVSSNDPLAPEVEIPTHLRVTGVPDIVLIGSQYDSTSTIAWFTSGATTIHTFFIVFPPVGSGLLSVTVDGDYDSDTENASVYVEGDFLGMINPSGNGPTTRTFAIAGDDLSGYVGDGHVVVTVENSYEVDTGYGADLHSVSLSYFGEFEDVLNFDGVIIGDSSSIAFTIENTGTDVLEISSMTVNSDVYSVSPPSPTIGYGEQEVVKITFHPTAVGSYTGTLTIHSNDPDEPSLEVDLQGEGVLAPDIVVLNAILIDTLFPGQMSTQDLTISNEGGSDLLFTISVDEGQPRAMFPEQMFPEYSIERKDAIEGEPLGHLELGKGERDPRKGPAVISGRGGPDGFGYTWIDSDEPGGPIFQWAEISGVGTYFSLTDDDYEEVSLPFLFSFYGEEKTSMKISSNGYLTFGDDGSDYGNDPIPDDYEPNDFIAPFWDDLNPGSGGDVYSYFDAARNRYIVQYTDIVHIGGSGQYTFQVILNTDGSILFQYLSVTGRLDGATIGIENSDGSDGLEVAFNTDYVHNNLAVRIAAVPGWVSVGVSSGSVPAGSSMDVEVTLDATGLSEGEYEANIVITSNDPDEAFVMVPVSLHVSSCFQGDCNLDGSINVLDMVCIANIIMRISEPTSQQYCTADCNGDGLINVLDMVCVANIIMGETASPRDTNVQPAVLLEVPSVACEDGFFPFRFQTNIDVAALQLFVGTQDRSLSFQSVQSLLDIKDVTVASNCLGNEFGVIIYSQSGAMIPPGTYEIFRAFLSDDVSRQGRIEFSTEDIICVASGGEQVPIEVKTSLAASKVSIPGEFRLGQNYPNPFNPHTAITYTLPQYSHVQLSIYNILGSQVMTLVDGDQPPGYYTVTWNGEGFASGVYYYRIVTDDFSATKRMVFMK